MDTWNWLATVRQGLLDQLVELPSERWDAETLCSEWRVRDVVAHTIFPERLLSLPVVAGIARAGFNVDRYLKDDAIRRGSAPIADLIAEYRGAVHRRTWPGGPEHLLADVFIHAQDIRRPLGLSWGYDPEPLLRVLAHVTAGRKVKAKIAGLRLRATDVEWSSSAGDGAGDLVTGPAEALILALAGRTVALPDLSGPGVRALN